METDAGGELEQSEPASTILAGSAHVSTAGGLRSVLAAIVRLFLALAMCLFVAYLLIDLVMQLPLALGLVRIDHDMSSGDGHYSQWPVVVVTTAILSFFTLAYVVPLGKANWRSAGLVQGFILALFTEMYGFPLTVYFLASYLGVPFVGRGLQHLDGHLIARALAGLTGLDPDQVAALVMAVSSGLMALGFIIIALGWRQIYRSRGELVTDGLYRVVRHPQYMGILVVTFALLIHWPTLITVAMWPVLLITYYKLARREERQAEASFGDAYRDYRRQTGMILPAIR